MGVSMLRRGSATTTVVRATLATIETAARIWSLRMTRWAGPRVFWLVEPDKAKDGLHLRPPENCSVYDHGLWVNLRLEINRQTHKSSEPIRVRLILAHRELGLLNVGPSERTRPCEKTSVCQGVDFQNDPEKPNP